MSGLHDSIVAEAAKAALGPLGFQRKGRSRLWIADHGSWLNVVEFTPSRWSKGASLLSGAHWLWAGIGFLSFDYAVTSNSRATFQNEVQFRIAAAQIAQEAAAEARRIESKFGSFAAIREFVVVEAHANDRLRPSWFGYYAGIASALEGRADDAAFFLTGLTDERATKYVDALVSKMGHPDCFAEEINRRVKEQRTILKLPELIGNPF